LRAGRVDGLPGERSAAARDCAVEALRAESVEAHAEARVAAGGGDAPLAELEEAGDGAPATGEGGDLAVAQAGEGDEGSRVEGDEAAGSDQARARRRRDTPGASGALRRQTPWSRAISGGPEKVPCARICASRRRPGAWRRLCACQAAGLGGGGVLDRQGTVGHGTAGEIAGEAAQRGGADAGKIAEHGGMHPLEGEALELAGAAAPDAGGSVGGGRRAVAQASRRATVFLGRIPDGGLPRKRAGSPRRVPETGVIPSPSERDSRGGFPDAGGI